MKRLLKFDSQAREKILEGINTLAEAVATTLGPKGRNVTIKMGSHQYDTYHDGVTVAKAIYLGDEFQDAAIQLVKEAAQKTNDIAGDGTTTSTILAQAMIVEGLKNIQAGMNPQTLKSGIEKAVTVAVKNLKSASRKLKTAQEIEQVATISAADPVLGKLVSDALAKVGNNGVITVEVGSGSETFTDYKEGLEFDKGYSTTSPYFVTDSNTVESVINNPYILLTDKRLTRDYDIVPFVESYIKAGGSKDLVIIAGEVSAEALATLVINKLKGGWNILAVQAPAWGGRRIDELEDLAVITGGKVIFEDSGRLLDSVTIDELGRAEKIVCDRDKTLITGGKGSKEAIGQKVASLEAQIKVANTDYDKEIKKQRLGKISNGIAVINVGGFSETEIKEKKERIIDAVNATKAAVEEGIVSGGETALLHSSVALGRLKLQAEEQIGVDIVRKALQAPFNRLMSNAGLNAGSCLGEVLKAPEEFGIDVNSGQLVNLIEAGIIDPVKVTRSALENAASVATMLLTTNVLIVDEPEDSK